MTLSYTSGLAVISHATHTAVLNLPLLAQQQSPFVFEGTAHAIWNEIAHRPSREELITALSQAAAGVDREVVEADVNAFIDQLMQLGLVSETA